MRLPMLDASPLPDYSGRQYRIRIYFGARRCIVLRRLRCDSLPSGARSSIAHRERERAAASSESRKLTEIFERYFEAYLELFPLLATRIRRASLRWPLSKQSQRRTSRAAARTPHLTLSRT